MSKPQPTPAKSTTKETKEATVPTATTTKKQPPKREASPHPLSHLIPSDFFKDEYVGRDVADGVSDMEMFAAAHRLKHNVLLAGPTGSAKTSAVYAYAASIGMPVVNVACNGGIDYDHLIGGWRPKSDGSGFQFVPGDLVLGAMHGAIILLNEVNFMPPKISAILYGLLDRRRTLFIPDAAGSDFPTTVQADPSTLIVADYNPGYAGTRQLNQAFKNRFAFKIDWGYNHDVEYTMVVSETLLSTVEALRQRVEVGDFTTPITSNMMLEFEQFCYDDVLGFDFAVANFVASFEPDERQAVAEVFKKNKDAILAELQDDTDAADDSASA